MKCQIQDCDGEGTETLNVRFMVLTGWGDEPLHSPAVIHLCKRHKGMIQTSSEVKMEKQ